MMPGFTDPDDGGSFIERSEGGLIRLIGLCLLFWFIVGTVCCKMCGI